ncbi:MAG TPA: hypothetical protein VK476_06900, partial [Flavobacterium sp.]|nr:hypothetical protein [Flavobacterium sp.]
RNRIYPAVQEFADVGHFLNFSDKENEIEKDFITKLKQGETIIYLLGMDFLMIKSNEAKTWSKSAAKEDIKSIRNIKMRTLANISGIHLKKK